MYSNTLISEWTGVRGFGAMVRQGMTNTINRAIRPCHKQGKLSEHTRSQCTDGKDSDFDGKVDCHDPGCKKWYLACMFYS